MTRFLKLIFKTGLVFFLIGAAGVAYYFCKYQSWQINMVTYNKQLVIEPSNVDKIDIDGDTVDIVLASAKQDKIVAQLTGEVNEKNVTEPVIQSSTTPDGTLHLTINVQHQIGFLFGSAHDLHLQLILPQKVYEDLNIRTSTGSLHVGIVEAKSGIIRTSTGDVMIDGFHGDELKIASSTGDILLTNVESKATINSQTGDVVVLPSFRLTQDLFIDTSTGDISLSLKEQPQSVDLHLLSNTGDVIADLSNINYQQREEHRVVGSIGTNGPHLQANSATGDITVAQAE